MSINDLALYLQAQDARRALALVPTTVVEDALAPCGAIVRDAVLRGGRVSAPLLVEGKA